VALRRVERELFGIAAMAEVTRWEVPGEVTGLWAAQNSWDVIFFVKGLVWFDIRCERKEAGIWKNNRKRRRIRRERDERIKLILVNHSVLDQAFVALEHNNGSTP